MKFGKLLRLQANLKWNSKWFDYYVDYKGFKKHMKSHLDENRRISLWKNYQAEFKPRWNREIAKVNNFMKREIELLNYRLEKK
mmetsp:Transcript_4384/g.9652  ORF Transcript_4384/g.9652 Transcript_4384/m.9652 type:complete len:83 (+) Transcript_4384:253-501(+)